jgi:hypothetical protein
MRVNRARLRRPAGGRQTGTMSESQCMHVRDDAGTPATADRLAVGTTVSGVVACHHEFGLGVKLAGRHDQYAHVDIISIDPHGPPLDPSRFPPIGASVRGDVLGYSPRGQLKLRLDSAASSPAGPDLISDWQAASGYVFVERTIEGWRPADESNGRRRNPAAPRPVPPWPYPLRGIVVEVRTPGGRAPAADNFREVFYAIDDADERVFICRDDARRLGDR